ncbi:MAG TPA: dihydroorotase [Dinghuibacter sp.]|uniref:dihydroorotase n=1 Tax=Dinghuibacter sp. TaxID=2024697 RepID=UPI002C05078E|nr:dihydroorotase [Dinghuibacter sp.]HTJ14955.1 dihydroorotase [Dinghuibacter sp.]
MDRYLIKNIHIVNEGKTIAGDLLIESGRIAKIGGTIDANATEIDGTGKHLLPGVIDDQVHFREPGLTHKATIATESRAAVAGGVTSFMEMPNTIPNALTQELLEDKYAIGAANSLANYSFFMGVSNDNADEVLKTNDKRKDVCGIKIFMGSSTGNMLVDNYLTLDRLFRESEVLIATHCEDEKIIKENYARIKGEKEDLEPADHPRIRDEEACFSSSFTAVQFAKKYNSRLHILHISTARELQLFTNMIPLTDKRITTEVCVHHLSFTADDYARLGYQIKCNPAIKASFNRDALWEALLDDRLDVIATDHAPHTWAEKQPPYEKAHSGLPLVQHSLPLMLHARAEGKISLETIARKMSHAVADCFQIEGRGYIREGYKADLVIVDTEATTTISRENLLYKCGWSPLEGQTLKGAVSQTFVNGRLIFENGYGKMTVHDSYRGERLSFSR